MTSSRPYSREVEKAIYEVALEIANAEDRDQFLRLTCQSDFEMLERISGMLAIQPHSEQFFSLPPVEMPGTMRRIFHLDGLPDDQEFADSVIASEAFVGHYRLLNQLGQGGCGVVYRAEQLEPIRREVALKVIRWGMDTDSVIARFELERKALALMDHPNIAWVLDAGSTSSGRPFFVMELVEGDRITHYCRSRNLSIRERIEIVIKVCHAIQHAHQKGVIHRDIKPSNVLVRETASVGEPKVIDFGIMKSTLGDQDCSETVTRFGQVMGTPAYMSPEQALSSADLDTRADIYSLGALLYEVICDRPPFLFENAMMDLGAIEQIRHTVLHVNPDPPSKVMGDKSLRDLDWIIRKAMAKNRQLRYASVNGLVMDLSRFCRNEPIQARPPGLWYELTMLAKRHRVIFLGSGIAVMGLVIGLTVAVRMFFLEKEASENQVQLRLIAESALATQAELRKEAESQNLAAQASLLLRKQKLEEADRLLAKIEIGRTPSSLEAARTFRALADWNRAQGRMKDSAERYASFARATTSIDGSDSHLLSLEVLPACAMLCYTGNVDEYRRMREFMIQRFSSTNHPIVAEQILKASLLLPGEKRHVEPLMKLLYCLECDLADEHGVFAGMPEVNGWSYFALALAYYRFGKWEKSKDLLEFCLKNPERMQSIQVSCRCLLSMVEADLGNSERASMLFEQDRAFVQSIGGSIFGPNPPPNGEWFDWVNLLVFRAEAEKRLSSK